MIIDFTKMQGLGNDYIYIDCINNNINIDNVEEFVKKVSNRNFGIGSDGVIFILPSEIADVKMQMYNADGTKSNMCGNGIRCVGKYCYDHGIAKKKEINVETLAGIKKLKFQIKNDKVEKITVNMGKANLKAEEIPINKEKAKENKKYLSTIIDNREYIVVSMGNPHAITFVDNIDKETVENIGKKVENSIEIFPERTNVEFIKIENENKIKMRGWERGTGDTLACGTGACASAVASYLKGYTKEKVEVELLGGNLEIEIKEDLEVFMTGPAVEVFEGKFEWR